MSLMWHNPMCVTAWSLYPIREPYEIRCSSCWNQELIPNMSNPAAEPACLLRFVRCKLTSFALLPGSFCSHWGMESIRVTRKGWRRKGQASSGGDHTINLSRDACCYLFYSQDERWFVFFWQLLLSPPRPTFVWAVLRDRDIHMTKLQNSICRGPWRSPPVTFLPLKISSFRWERRCRVLTPQA